MSEPTGMPPEKPPDAAPQRIGVAILEHAGQVLVGKRSADQVLAGLHEFPGGKCRPGESPAACTLRECLEETGIAAAKCEFLHRADHRYDHAHVQIFFYRCVPASLPVAAPLPPFEWIPLTQLSACQFPEANQAVLKLLAGQHS